MTKHTPGPWHVQSQKGKSNKAICANYDGETIVIAKTTPYDPDYWGNKIVGTALKGLAVKMALKAKVSLKGANLKGADLRGADLVGADLEGAYLGGANLDSLQIRSYKHDLWGILLRFRSEIPGLIAAIKKGKIDGSVYSGECCCLIGTVANIQGCDVNSFGDEIKDHNSPIEQWFQQIKPGHTPENYKPSAMVLEWIEEFLELDCRNK